MKKSKVALFVAVCVAVLFLIAIIVVRIYCDVQFNSSLPDAAEAGELCYARLGSEHDYFYNDKNVSVLMPDDGFCMKDVDALKYKNVQVLLVREINNAYIKEIAELKDALSVGSFYVPKGIKKEELSLLQEAYPDADIWKVSKQDKVVVEDYVIYFYGDRKNNAVLLTHGNYDFIVSDISLNGIMKELSADVAIIPVDALKASKIDSKYAILKTGETALANELVKQTMYYVPAPEFDMVALCTPKNGIYFDVTFNATGKMETR